MSLYQTTSEEITVETRLAHALSSLSPSIPLHLLQGSKTLVHPADLPFKISETPDIFTSFRKAVEGLGPDTMVRPCLKSPAALPPFPPSDVLEPSKLPTSLSDLLPHLLKPFYPDGNVPSFPHEKSAHPFVGGETSGLERLDKYCGRNHEKAPLGTYKQTRNGLVGSEYSSKFSSWLGVGCISPRRVAEEIREWEQKWTHHGKGTKDSYW